MGWITAFVLVAGAWKSWRLHQERKTQRGIPPKRPPDTATGQNETRESGSVELGEGGFLRRFTPPGFDSPRDVGGRAPDLPFLQGETTHSSVIEFSAASVELVGLVDDAQDFVSAHGRAIADGWCIQGFQLVAWARDGEPAQQRELSIQRPLPDKKFRNDVLPGKVVRMRVFVDDTGTTAVVDELIACDEALGEFASIRAQRRQPLLFATTEFGSLEYNRKRRQFEGSGEWNGDEIDLSFHATSVEALEQLLPAAETVWREQTLWSRRMNTALCSELLDTANDWTHDMGDPAMSCEEFLARLRLRKVSFDGAKRFTFWHDDGDVFGGHVVEALGSLERGIYCCVFEG